MRFICCVTMIYLFLPLAGIGQRKLSLNQVLDMAGRSSIYAKLAESQQEVAVYLFKTYQSDLRPQISFTGNIPMYTHAYSAITQPDGTIKFIAISQNLSYAGFSLSQVLPMTGGMLSVNTNLSRFDDFRGNYKQYNATPVFVALNQPFAAYNALKWAKKIEPLRYAEAQRAYSVELENIKLQVSDLYFNVLAAQDDIQVSLQNLTDYKTNYDIEKQRIDLGTTNMDRLTQLELQILQAEQSHKLAQYQLKMAKLNLKIFIGWADLEDFELLLPALEKVYYPDVETAIGFAKKNRPEYLTFERKLLEAQGELSRSKAEKYNISLSATVGYNNSDVLLKASYEHMRSQQTLGLGLNVPVMDWGRRDAKIRMARANLKLQQYQNTLDEVTLTQQVTTLVENLVLLESSVLQAEKVQELAESRYDLAQQLYKAGKYSITDLTIAQAQKDQARKARIEACKSYWNAHYSFRKLTGYDPVRNESVSIKR